MITEKYWKWLPRAVKFFIIGFSGIIMGFGLLYVIPYSDSALWLLAGIDFFSLCFLMMGVAYAIFDIVQSYRKKKNTSNNNTKEVNDEKPKE